MNLVYNISISFYSFLIFLVSPFNLKARQLKLGRKKSFALIRQNISKSDKTIWVHCASLGEFEQGRPLIESIKKLKPEYKILLTFFSPSGYEIRKNFEFADCICYLPADTPNNVRKFLELSKPELVFFIKYEYWFNYINELNSKKIPVYLVSAIFRQNQVFFSNSISGRWYKKILEKIDHFFVQDQNSIDLLKGIGINKATLAGDTRFDRVAEIAKNSKEIQLAEKFKGDSLTIVAGSTWFPDEEILADFINNNPEVKFIIAPHEIKPANIQKLINLLKTSFICYTQANENTVINKQVLIVDTIGILSALYKYADIAYIGGGFGVGIHNTLEAAIFGVPVLFGPNYQKFNEAVTMVQKEIAFPVVDAETLKVQINKILFDQQLRINIEQKSKDYTSSNIGATRLIINSVLDKI